ncbi:MAG TPA: molybdenum cofactor guanylyltransferase MobA [Pseudomonas xinjiangensis]|uniref:Molybdenum cofactor guanylyltransferase n=2 Tax=root TaxID=1 RepID=A0A7V1FT40_9GAMM|nr:molybdenum cofactor guanylyltransferase MobA [Halopseudomonas xinjiangensis]HEC47179.1 molybdenum cofactor guanylyltransferase MobA [Halopseudomonas xinjiangensis]
MTNADHFRPSALLLAGGQGSRLGGRDKGLMPWLGQPIAGRLAHILRDVSNQVIISCNRNHDQYAQWADLLVSDQEAGFPGPLAGILRGLEYCAGTHLLVIPCDLLYLDATLLRDLLELAQSRPEQPWLVKTGERWQPLVSVIPLALASDLQAFWDAGHRSPMRWILARPYGVIELQEDDPRLHNANLPEDWHED